MSLTDKIALFECLHKEWFANRKYWFSKNPGYDKYLCEKFYICLPDNYQYQEEFNKEKLAVQIGAILALDQIPRHMKRLQQHIDCNTYSQVASEVALSLMSYLSNDVDLYNSVTAYEWCFILLPFRHINDKGRLNTIVKFIIEKYKKPDTPAEDKAVYKSYLQKTLKRVHLLNTEQAIKEQVACHKICMNTPEQWNKYTNVLQHIPADPIVTDIHKPKSIYLIAKFLETMKNTEINSKNIVISLSGGVDSCVCLYLARQLYPLHTIIAVHINYDNREECTAEFRFVRKYCAVLNIKLFHRDICEIKRSDCHYYGLRDLYENITREIRFDMYKKLSEMHSPAVIILGHNADDCLENIVTNICLKQNYHNLSGMNIDSDISGLQMLRPLLNVRKCDIIGFAIQMNIPFLKNSTPTWSARGKIRDNVLPALQGVHNDAAGSLLALKDYVQSMDVIAEEYFHTVILPKFTQTEKDLQASFSVNEIRCIAHLTIWQKIFTTYGIKVSHKAIIEFIAFIKRINSKKHKFVLNPHTIATGFVKNEIVHLTIK